MNVLSAPLTVFLGFTNKCNLRCGYCSSTRTYCSQDLPTSKLIYLIDTIKQMRIPNVVIFGGEPLLRRDFFILLKRFDGAQLALILDTNATLINKTVARQLRHSAIKHYFVSLDGSCAQVHDATRGKNAFRFTLAGIENLIHEGCPVSLTTVVHRLNYNNLEHIITLGQHLGVKQVRLNKLWCTGESPLRYRSLLLRATERRSVTKAVYKLTTQYGSFISGPLVNQLQITTHHGSTRSAKWIRKKMRCLAGVIKCAVRPDGWVTPCEKLWDIKAGHIAEESLQEIWRRSPVLQAFRRGYHLRLEKTPECIQCRSLSVCDRTAPCSLYYISKGNLEHKRAYCLKYIQ